MTFYKCRKCGYKTKFFRDLKNHINIIKTCIKDFSCLDLTNDEILITTLIPYIDNNQNLDLNKIKKYKYTYQNKQSLFDDLFFIDKNKIKICKYCNQKFSKIQNLKEHIIIECFEKEMERKNVDYFGNNNNNLCSTINIQGNSNNITNITNITNINNITLKIEHPISFDENWDTSKITEAEKCQLILSKLMYTKLLGEILKNDANLNVVIDTNKDFGIVYKNESEKYIKMEIKEIIENSMAKIHQKLLEINDELKKTGLYEDFVTEYKRKDITNKHQCYVNNKDIQEKVNYFIACVFNNKKEDSHKIMKEYLLNSSKNDNEIDY